MILASLACGPLAAQLSISNRAAITDLWGLEVAQDGSERRMFAGTNKVAGREHLLITWNVNWSNADVLTGLSMDIMEGRDQDGRPMFGVSVEGSSAGQSEVRAYVQQGQNRLMTQTAPLTGIHQIMVEWKKGIDGFIRILLDGVEFGQLTGIDTDYTAQPLFLLYFGAPNESVGFTGWYSLDDVFVDDASAQWPESIAIWIEKPLSLSVP